MQPASRRISPTPQLSRLPLPHRPSKLEDQVPSRQPSPRVVARCQGWTTTLYRSPCLSIRLRHGSILILLILISPQMIWKLIVAITIIAAFRHTTTIWTPAPPSSQNGAAIPAPSRITVPRRRPFRLILQSRWISSVLHGRVIGLDPFLLLLIAYFFLVYCLIRRLTIHDTIISGYERMVTRSCHLISSYTLCTTTIYNLYLDLTLFMISSRKGLERIMHWSYTTFAKALGLIWQ